VKLRGARNGGVRGMVGWGLRWRGIVSRKERELELTSFLMLLQPMFQLETIKTNMDLDSVECSNASGIFVPIRLMVVSNSLAPMFDRLDLDPSLTKIKGTFPPPRHAPFSRQRPNTTADKVWDEILIDRFIPISRAEIVKMGKNPDTTVKLLDNDWGLGDDA
ncbi:hypothetical protein IFR05_017350, partial [Cadophora sp. M221]